MTEADFWPQRLLQDKRRGLPMLPINTHVTARRLRIALRSRGEIMATQTSVFSADTIGEIGLRYRLELAGGVA